MNRESCYVNQNAAFKQVYSVKNVEKHVENVKNLRISGITICNFYVIIHFY